MNRTVRNSMLRLICDSYGSSNISDSSPENHETKREEETLDDISEIYHYMPAVSRRDFT